MNVEWQLMSLKSHTYSWRKKKLYSEVALNIYVHFDYIPVTLNVWIGVQVCVQIHTDHLICKPGKSNDQVYMSTTINCTAYMCSLDWECNVCIDTCLCVYQNSPPKPWMSKSTKRNVTSHLAVHMLLHFKYPCETIFICEVNARQVPC